MSEFLSRNPEYFVYLLICITLVFRVIYQVIRDERKDDDEDDGGILKTDPELDLPPGVTLPVDGPRELVS